MTSLCIRAYLGSKASPFIGMPKRQTQMTSPIGCRTIEGCPQDVSLYPSLYFPDFITSFNEALMLVEPVTGAASWADDFFGFMLELN